jgi:methylated-DNA-protein-cysteine methyltransferase-like protein
MSSTHAKALPEDRILAAIRAVPAGRTTSYGEIARLAGLPGRARLVAKTLAGNDDPDLPWHRVLRADGRIALPPGSRGFREQSARLKREGVTVENGRVRPTAAGSDIDALLWGPPT